MSVMMGLMQTWQLTTATLIDHAALGHGMTEIVSRGPDNRVSRSNWRTVSDRARALAAGLFALGATAGDRVATLAWNRTAHLELYFGVTAAGLVLHTVNPRLFPEQIRYIIDHGGARILCVDPDLLPVLEPLAPQLTHVEHIVVLCGRDALPASSLPGLIAYEDLLTLAAPLDEWPQIDERAACVLCYTSGTTGDPKGVLYSHRSTVLHAFAACAADSMAISACDSVLLITPLFHVNAWGVPFAAAMTGAKLVLPGASLDGAALYALLRDEGVTFSLGVPTVWFALLDYIVRETSAEARALLKLNRVLMGGAVGDAQKSLGIDGCDIAGVEPPLRIDGRAGCGPEIAVDDPRPAHFQQARLCAVMGQWLTQGVLDPQLHAEHRTALGRAQFEKIIARQRVMAGQGPRNGCHRARFGHAPGLDRDGAEHIVEPFDQCQRDRRAAHQHPVEL